MPLNIATLNHLEDKEAVRLSTPELVDCLLGRFNNSNGFLYLTYAQRDALVWALCHPATSSLGIQF